ncbi:MAG: hypothetical protein P8Z79_21105 [Sedimentisphaerales bacterium]
MRHRTFLLVAGVLFWVNGFVVAEQTIGGDSGKLSRDALSAMEGNQATLDSIRTMQATLTKSSSHSFSGKKGYNLEERHRIVCDGDHFRKDQLETWFRGADEYRGYEKALPIGQVDIDSAQLNIDYFPPNSRVFVRPPKWSESYKIRTNDLMKYQSARGATLKEKTLKIWVVPSKGYCIKKMQDGSKGKIDDEYTTTLKEYSPGTWWFGTVKATKSTGLETVVCRLSLDSLIFNAPLDPDVFTVWGLDITSRTTITDEMQGTTSTLAIDDAKEVATDPTNSSGKTVKVGLGILGLTVVTFLGIFVKGKKACREQRFLKW